MVIAGSPVLFISFAKSAQPWESSVLLFWWDTANIFNAKNHF